MKTNTPPLFNIKHAALGIAVAGLLLSSVFMPIQKAQASVSSDLLAQIQQLMQVVLSLQSQVEALDGSESEVGLEGGFTDKSIAVGDRVQTTDTLKVRAGAGSSENWINNMSAYSAGKVIDGPRYANGYTWWHITYDAGTSGWSAENWLLGATPSSAQEPLDETEYINDEEEDYDLEITHPDKYDQVYTGDSIRLRWEERNLEGEQGIVTLEGNNSQIHLAEYVDIGDEGMTVTLPEYQTLGIVSETVYDLKLWVSYVKDGSPKAVADTVQITIKPQFASTEDNDVDVDKFTGSVRDSDDAHGPYVDLVWKTTGTESCNLFYNGTHITTRDSDDEYTLSNTALTEKYGLSGFGGTGKFELRCQSQYTQKDSTVSEYKTVVFD
ncbi:MAG: hypothetical protein ACI9H6_000261, partial [Patiriisocius sp.]